MSVHDVFFRESKARWIRALQRDIKNDCGIDIPDGYGFTRERYFYFIVIGDRKYVHKESLSFLCNEGGTYVSFINESMDETQVNRIKSENQQATEGLFTFFRKEINSHSLYPQLIEETEKLFIFKNYRDSHEPLNSLDKSDAKYIRECYRRDNRGRSQVMTPFCQNLFGRMVKNRETGEIIIDDLEAFDFRKKTKLVVLMQKYRKMDRMYILERCLFRTKKDLLAPFLLAVQDLSETEKVNIF